MVTKTAKSVDDIVADLKVCGFEVKQSGYRLRVTDPNGVNLPVFMPTNITGRNVAPQINRLRTHGYDISKADEARAAQHAAAVEEANRKAAIELAAIEEKNKAKAAEVAAVTQFQTEVIDFNRRAMASALASSAHSIQGEDIHTDVRFDTIMLDAAFAKELLRHNEEWVPNPSGPPLAPRERKRTNRPISGNWVEQLAQEMVLGNWVLVHQGIALDKDGNLLDGQHRLHALIRADEIKPGIQIPMVISYDWEPVIFDRVDQGRTRTLTDLLGLLGEGNRFAYSTALRLAYRFDDNPAVKGWRSKISDHELLNYADRIEQAAAAGGYIGLRDTLPEGQAIGRGCGMVSSAASVALFVCRRAWPNGPHEEFAEGLRLGYTVEEGGRLPLVPRDPRQALINHLKKTSNKRGSGVNAQHLALYIKTWRLWVLRREATIIKLGPNELFPIPPSGEDTE